MHIVYHAHLSCQQLGGARTRVAVDRACGVSAFELRLIELDPGAQLPDCMHTGELVVLALSGQGKLHLPSGPQRFAAPCSLFIPAHAPYRISNNAATSLQLVVVCSRPPEVQSEAGVA